jgi:tetratricopeptide (TPR) repeat protein
MNFQKIFCIICTISLAFTCQLSAQVKTTTTELSFHEIPAGDILLSGKVDVSTRFVFIGYPYLQVEYDNLVITRAYYKGERFFDDLVLDAGGGINWPFYPETGGYSIDVNFKVRVWGHSSYFDMPGEMYPITTRLESEEIDQYFRNLDDLYRSDEEIWIKSYLIDHEIISLSPNIGRQLTQRLDIYLERERRKNAVSDALREHCSFTFYDMDRLNQAVRAVNEAYQYALTDDERNSLNRCSEELGRQRQVIIETEIEQREHDERMSDPYAYAIRNAEQAEENGNIREALRFYREAYAYNSSYYLAQKIEQLQQRADVEQVGEVTGAIVTGLFSELRSGSTELMNGVFSISGSMGSHDYGITPGLGSYNHQTGSLFILAEKIFWLNSSEQVGLALGANINSRIDGYYLDGANDRTLYVENRDINLHLGLNFGRRIEITGLLRHLKLKGELSGRNQNDDSFDTIYGGNGGLATGIRGAVYLARQREFFIRGVGIYVDSRSDGQFRSLNVWPISDIEMHSYGYRLELAYTPFIFSFYSTTDTYINLKQNGNFGFNHWGIGIGFGGGL